MLVSSEPTQCFGAPPLSSRLSLYSGFTSPFLPCSGAELKSTLPVPLRFLSHRHVEPPRTQTQATASPRMGHPTRKERLAQDEDDRLAQYESLEAQKREATNAKAKRKKLKVSLQHQASP